MTIASFNLDFSDLQKFRDFRTLLSTSPLVTNREFAFLQKAVADGSIFEIGLTSTRYEVGIVDALGAPRGRVIYEGSGFNGTLDGNPQALTPNVINLGTVINEVRFTDVNRTHDLVRYTGHLSLIDILGLTTNSGSFSLNEIQIGSPELGAYIKLNGSLSAALTTPDLTVNGLFSSLTLYVRQGAEAYRMVVTGNLSATNTHFRQNVATGDIQQLFSQIGGEINAFSFSRISYADSSPNAAQAGIADILSLSNLHLDPTELQKLVFAGYASLDASFDSDGLVETEPLEFNNGVGVAGAAIQSDGRILVAYAGPGAISGDVDIARYSTIGQLDGRFQFAPDTNQLYFPRDIALQNGKIIVAGNRRFDIFSSADEVFVGRLNADGTPDTSFDTDGLALAAIPSVEVAALAITPDDKIVVVGSAQGAVDSELAVFRFTANGAPDTSFDGDGRRLIDLVGIGIGGDLGASVAVQSDNKIVIGGLQGDVPVVVRLNADGSFDGSFDGDGIAELGISFFPIKDVLVQPDGGIVAAGFVRLMHLSSNGLLEQSIFVRTPPGFFRTGELVKLARLPDGDLLFGETLMEQVSFEPRLAVTRIRPDGTREDRFGDGGTVVIPHSGRFRDIVVQPDGGIVLIGEASHVIVARLIDPGIVVDQTLLLGDDILVATADSKIGINGYTGNDTITGGNGDDVLVGGAGDDLLSGRGGKDTFLYETLGNGLDHIADFMAGDRIRVNGTALIFDGAGDGTSVAQSHVQFESVGTTTKIYVGTDSTANAEITLTLDNLSGLTASEFRVSGRDIGITRGGNSAPTFVTPGDGIATSAIGISAMTGLPDGRLAVAGGSGFAVGRYNLDGSPDNSFDGDGIATTGPLSGTARGIALDRDGNLVVGNFSNSPNFELARYRNDGTLDPGFSLDGRQSISFAAFGVTGGIAQNVIALNDGRLAVVGITASGFTAPDGSDGTFDTDFALALLDERGELVSAVTTDFSGSAPGLVDWAYAVAEQTDGKLVVVGRNDNRDIAIARYNPDGSLDLNFDGDGRVIRVVGAGDDVAQAVAIQADGRIIVGGAGIGATKDFLLTRFNSDGSVDNSFGTSGAVSVAVGSGADVIQAVAVQADGKIVAAGYSTSADEDIAIARFNADGSLDSSFDGDGRTTVSIAGNERGNALVLQADGKIVVAGQGNSGNGLLVRLNPDGSLDTTFDAGPSTLNATPAFTEGGAAVVLDSNVTVFDYELNKSGNYAGAVLNLVRHGGPNADDRFSGAGINAGQASGTVIVAGTTIGLYTWSAGTLSLLFNTSATQPLVDQAMQSIAYANINTNPVASVQIDWIFNDGNVGVQGAGGPLKALGSTTVAITAVANPTPPVVTPTNLAPSAGTAPADQNAFSDRAFSFTLPTTTITDPNGDALSYTARLTNGNALPPWLSFNAATRTFSGTPEAADAGSLTLHVTASDPAGLSASIDFRINIDRAVVVGDTAFIVDSDQVIDQSVRKVISEVDFTLPEGVIELVLTKPGRGIGNTGDNTITGSTGNDTLDGRDGNDSLAGGDGDDIVDGGDGDDQVAGGNGADFLVGARGNDTLSGGADNDTLAGGEGDDVLDPGEGNNLSRGGGGTDILRLAGSLADIEDIRILTTSNGPQLFTLNGLEAGEIVQLTSRSGRVDRLIGIETITFTDSQESVAVNREQLLKNVALEIDPTNHRIDTLGVNTLDGGKNNDILEGIGGDDTLTGNAGNDTLLGADGNDTLIGGAGNDVLNGGTGIDVMIGGIGNDLYFIDDVADSIVEAATGGNDTIRTLLQTGDLSTQANIENIEFIGDGVFTSTGNARGNSIKGGSDDDSLDGRGGADILTGGDGNDTYLVDGLDRVIETALGGNDTVQTRLGTLALTAAIYREVENIEYLGTGAFVGIGSALDNRIAGGRGNDKLNGGAGNDSLIGAAGRDSLSGGSGDDILDGGSGNDVIDGGAGIDTVVLAGNRIDYRLERLSNSSTPDVRLLHTGTGEIDTLKGIETLHFADGSSGQLNANDLLANTVSPFDDSVVGSDGVDDTIDGGNGRDTLSGGGGNDTLLGGAGNDILNGGSGDDQIRGGIGDDMIDGGSGANRVEGGAGNDLYLVRTEEDVVVELSGQGIDRVQTSLAVHSLALNVERLEYTGQSDFIGTGNAGANTLIGASGNDSLDGDRGADLLMGRAGDDIYVVDNALDVVREDAGEGSGTDLVRSKISVWQLRDNIENLERENPDALTTFTGTGNRLDNRISGGAGIDILSGADGNDTLSGAAGRDQLNGGNGNDRLDGGTGIDTLIGGAGEDTLTGGAGADRLIGGSNDDRFVFDFDPLLANGNDSADTLVDFSAGDKIVLALSAFAGLGVAGSLDGDAVVLGKAATDLNDRIIYDRSTGQLFYDADGSGERGAMLIAVLTNKAALAVEDFVVQ